MATDNETVASVTDYIRHMADNMPNGVILNIAQCNFTADRIEAAHKRELAVKDDERLTIVANYENVIAAKDAEIAELRECLKEAIREMCPFTRMSCKHSEPCDYECGTEKWRKALEGARHESETDSRT